MTFVAASIRFVMAVVCLLALPRKAEAAQLYLAVFGVYITFAAVFQWMIYINLGGRSRALVAGVIDLAMITFIVHRIGSTATLIVSLYFFTAMVNTIVVGRRLGMMLASLGALFYAVTLALEAARVLPFAPDGREGLTVPPSWVEAGVSAALMCAMIMFATALVGTLVRQNRLRELELVAANKKLEELSVRDPLTQLYNRRYLMERLEVELARVRRGRPLSVIMVDLDRFKRVNDDNGHQSGDQLLQDLARVLSGSVRETDVVGRYGGDEFVVLLPDTAQDHAQLVAARVVDGIREVGVRFDPNRPVTGSVGLAVAREDDNSRSLLQRADRASYIAKGAGGNRVSSEPGALLPQGSA